MYKGDLQLDNSNILHVLEAAQYFQLSELEQICSKKVYNHITTESIGILMKQAMALKSKTLQKTCQEYFAANTTKVLQSNTFLNFSQAALACLCDSETVNCTEKELFDACLKWAGKICDQTGRSRNAQNISGKHFE